jgi:lipoprotein-anchoring transpeptidase ErfK/SrfK
MRKILIAIMLAGSFNVGAARASEDAAQPASPSDASTPAQSTAAPPPALDLGVFNDAKATDAKPVNGASPAILRAEVMLDRLHASPGVIDGRDGANFQHALEVYEKAHDLKTTKAPGGEVWSSLLEASPGPVIIEHLLTPKDVEGPFYPDLPKDYGELAKLPAIGYRSPAQKIAAMFHMSEALLGALNPGADLAAAGTKLFVTDVSPKPVIEKIKTVVVDKTKSQVLGYDSHGHIIVSYPATIGSEELPSPSGTYKIKGIAFHPIYYYDPDKNFVQGDNKEKLKLPPGPNNPVGSVFIALTKPTYGLHGTPDPEKIDKTASHGCVRMTNWDADALAHLVKTGLIVRFKGNKT